MFKDVYYECTLRVIYSSWDDCLESCYNPLSDWIKLSHRTTDWWWLSKMVVRGMFCPGAPIFSTKYKHCASKKVIIIIHNNWHVFNELQEGGGL